VRRSEEEKHEAAKVRRRRSTFLRPLHVPATSLECPFTCMQAVVVCCAGMRSEMGW